MRRSLRLIAIANPWHLDEAEEELGDALFPYDKGCLAIKVDEFYPIIYVYSCLEPDKAFEYIIQEPPAYIERLIPVHLLIKQVIRLNHIGTDLEKIIRGLASTIHGKCHDTCNIEVHPRNFYIYYKDLMNKKKAQKLLQRELAKLLNLHPKRDAEWSLILEDTADGIVVAVLPKRSDRLMYWRLRRLGLK
jgi:hypothetical protein